jgi:hypothetical protein
MKLRRPRHRCPGCKSNNIYRRTMSQKDTEKSKKKGRYKFGEVVSDSVPKKYRCISCRNELMSL